ncbi:lipopolysaccharide-induced tumor necrosis factor-alpha factor homolog [Anoplophora glabripennis]|uniref:lipopolysaccharide-induced tumor necrosis factor-alpha factor homolog n=1 Tax=Anoplophora glabripennis TaxID=217634 RepID=UPI000873B50A|nr:lipopolysaccharide-induced tumor necrosis factor-alpha factor homolog [Anoplophora glabripennis]
MSKNSMPPPYGPPPAAPPSYAQAVGGVPPTSPYVPNHSIMKGPEIVTTVVAVGPNPTHMICPHCQAEIDTTTKSKPGLIAYISGAILCIIGCFWGCCLIPCCIEKCMDVSHTCPNCDAYLGTFKR